MLSIGRIVHMLKNRKYFCFYVPKVQCPWENTQIIKVIYKLVCIWKNQQYFCIDLKIKLVFISPVTFIKQNIIF